MSDIRKPGDAVGQVQQARDVLAKWRDEVQSPLPWRIRGQGNQVREVVDAGNADIVSLWSREEGSSAHLYDGDDRLIVGTAGNPDLLDAIDEMLGATIAAYEAWGNRVGRLTVDSNGRVARLAAAIIAADERMTS